MISIRRAVSWTRRGFVITSLSALLSALGVSGCASEDPSIWKRVDGKWSYDRTPFEAADPATLKAIDGQFAKDAVQAYYRGIAVTGSDAASFEVLSEHEARDRRAVYWGETYRKGQDYYTVKYARIAPIVDADPAAYRVLKYDYGSDSKRVFKDGHLLRGIRDPASFGVFTPRLSRDAKRAYFEDIEIPESDGASFEIADVHDDAWVRDGKHAWHVRHGQPESGQPVKREVRVLVGANAKALRPLGQEYATDGVRVWWRGNVLADVDMASFLPIEGDSVIDARDARGAFMRGRRPKHNP